MPELVAITQLLFQPIREATLNKLHCLLNRHFAAYRQEQMNVIWHDDKVMNFEFLGRYVRTQYFDE